MELVVDLHQVLKMDDAMSNVDSVVTLLGKVEIESTLQTTLVILVQILGIKNQVKD